MRFDSGPEPHDGHGALDDLADALLWAQNEGWASGKAGIAGASYGGYLCGEERRL